MLETLHLSKVYRPKKGVPVTALDDVSLLLPDTGMVFLLGKSGSGKSTLLNLLGGLDSATSGEIVIKGKSAASFDQKHLDSYRNTYVGFIFQEYNLLNDFSVGANVALAIELQGRKATDNEINRILTEVDLDGFGDRKPSELSGGQKQRVAIARALVKNPEIIMADEPTGALDSNTGKQVFDTLKKLSATKLVLVVSHDREFAEQYADRIIELADGKVISDLEYEPTDEGLSFAGATVNIAKGYRLTEDDRERINAYLEALETGADLRIGHAGVKAKATDPGKIRKEDGSAFALIRSKLPFRYAFRMGASGLKHKKIRLTFTILLSCVAFGLFGLADTFGAYDHVNTCARSIVDTGITYATVQKQIKETYRDDSYYYRPSELRMTEADLKTVQTDTGIEMHGIFVPRERSLAFGNNYDTDATFTETDYHIYAPEFSGYYELDRAELDRLGYRLIAGTLPDGAKDEIALTAYELETFKIGGYKTVDAEKTQPIQTADDMVGKTLSAGGVSYTVSGVVDTGMPLDRYKPLTEKVDLPKTGAEELADMALYSELMSLRAYSLHQIAFVGNGKIAAMAATEPTTKGLSKGGLWLETPMTDETVSDDDPYREEPTYYFGVNAIGVLADSKAPVHWLDGTRRTALGENEIVLAKSDYTDYRQSIRDLAGDDLPEAPVVLHGERWYYDSDAPSENLSLTVVGYIDSDDAAYRGTLFGHPSLFEHLVEAGENGYYSFAVGPMPERMSDIKDLVRYCATEGPDVVYRLQNTVTFELDAVHEILAELAGIFLWIGVGFAVFAALMLANFISTSISYKKQEIGILRAIGSRGNDVFRIFFSESLLIALINFALSTVGVFLATTVINHLIRTEVGFLVTVLSFGLRQVGLLLLISCLIALIASFLPVRRIASKKPIDAIRR